MGIMTFDYSVKEIERILVMTPYMIPSRYERRHFLYFIRCNEWVKVGHTNNVGKRLTHIGLATPYDLDLECSFETVHGVAIAAERHLHGHLQERHRRGEWFNISRDESGTFTDKVKELIACLEERRFAVIERRTAHIRALSRRANEKKRWADPKPRVREVVT